MGGGYEPLAAGEGTCSFLRGDDVLVAVGVRPESPVHGTLDGPRGRWRNVLRGGERSFDARTPVSDVLDEHGIAVYERL